MRHKPPTHRIVRDERFLQIETEARKKSFTRLNERRVGVPIKLRHTHNCNLIFAISVKTHSLICHRAVVHHELIRWSEQHVLARKIIPTFNHAKRPNAAFLGSFEKPHIIHRIGGRCKDERGFVCIENLCKYRIVKKRHAPVFQKRAHERCVSKEPCESREEIFWKWRKPARTIESFFLYLAYGPCGNHVAGKKKYYIFCG